MLEYLKSSFGSDTVGTYFLWGIVICFFASILLLWRAAYRIKKAKVVKKLLEGLDSLSSENEVAMLMASSEMNELCQGSSLYNNFKNSLIDIGIDEVSYRRTCPYA